MPDPALALRRCVTADVEDVARFVAGCPPLELHTSFTYWVTFEYWGDFCFLALHEGQIVGYVSAVGSGAKEGVLYIWQVGVAAELRGQRLSQRLIAAVAEAGRGKGFTRFQVSIASDNTTSLGAFRKFASDNDHTLDPCGEVKFSDAGGKAVHEVLYTFLL